MISHNSPLGLARRARQCFDEAKSCLHAVRIWRGGTIYTKQEQDELVRYARRMNQNGVKLRAASIDLARRQQDAA